MTTTSPTPWRRLLFCALLLLAVSMSSGAPKCDQKLLQREAKLIEKYLTFGGLEMAITSKALELRCRHLKRNLVPHVKRLERCILNDQDTMDAKYTKLLYHMSSAPINFILLLCDDPEFRYRFMANAECLRTFLTGKAHDCMDMLTDDYDARPFMPLAFARPDELQSPEDLFYEICCFQRKTALCFVYTIENHCGSDAADMFDTMYNMTVGSYVFGDMCESCFGLAARPTNSLDQLILPIVASLLPYLFQIY